MSWERCSRHCLGPSAADSDGSRSRSRSPECPFERLRLAESRDRGYGRAGRAGEWTYLTEISRWYRVRSADGVYSEFVSDRLTPLVNIHYITTYLYSKCVLCCILCTLYDAIEKGSQRHVPEVASRMRRTSPLQSLLQKHVCALPIAPRSRIEPNLHMHNWYRSCTYCVDVGRPDSPEYLRRRTGGRGSRLHSG